MACHDYKDSVWRTLFAFMHALLLMYAIGRQTGHYCNHPRPQVADRGTPSRTDKRVALDKEGSADKQCLGEGKTPI